MDKDTAKRYIDIAAGEARARYISVGAGQEGTYLIKAQQAKEYADANYTGDVPLFIQVESEATGLTPQQCADMILATQAQWFYIASQIEKVRRKAKFDLDSITDKNAIDEYCQATLTILDDL